MKKILLLGGSSQQIVAIEKAKELGYFTVLCDYLPDNPGQYHADKFYLQSTTDKEAIFKVALSEKIDGIVAYASDPAAPTAAYVAEKLGLPTNPYASVETLCNKDRFRTFLRDNGFHAPVSAGYSDKSVLAETSKFRLPVIVKPVDSSGSKGVTVLRDWNGLDQAVDFALSFSRCGRYIVEEFIEKKHKYLIGGDIFVSGGQIVLWGLMNCHRDEMVNPLVPVGKSYPPALEDSDRKRVRDCLQSLVEKLGIVSGAMNVELVIDRENRVWPIDIGPRNGGNMIPDLLGMIFRQDVVELTIQAAMGQPVSLTECSGTNYYCTHNLHSSQNGVLSEIRFSEELEKHIIKKCIYKKPGDSVFYFDQAAKALGIIFMKYESMDQMLSMLEEINNHIFIELQR